MIKSINIYNRSGNIDGTLDLPEPVKQVSGRTSRGESGLYYKGVGAEYKGHCVLDPAGYPDCVPSDVFYYGFAVKEPAWLDKYGIFKGPLQPYFSDHIGSCGPKELSIETKSKDCPVSGVEVVSINPIDGLENQYFITLRYTTDREPWARYGLTHKLSSCIETLTINGWCFPWDKGAIRDINADGSVTDVADMFVSHDPINLFGSVYAVLYSLHRLTPQRFITFTRSRGYKFKDIRDIPSMALSIMEEVSVDTSFGFPDKARDEWDVYYHLIGNCLLSGRNCAHVERQESGDNVAKQYQDRFFAQLKQHDIHRIKGFIKERQAA